MRSSARNRERSPLLRLPGEIRNQIYQYLMSGHIVYPSWRLHDDGSRQIVTYCAPEPADYANEGTHLWPLVPSLKYASRQLHAEIGNVPLAETLVRYKPGPTLWVSWLHTWSKEQKRAVKDVQILVQGFWRMPLDTIFLSFKDIKLLPNLRTVYIKEAFNPLDEAARQRIVARAQPNWQIVFERG